MPDIDRRRFVTSVAAGFAAAATPVGTSADRQARTGAASPARPAAGLAVPAFRPLPLGSITPAGWLQRQLRIQADGLSGHLDEFWPDVGQSQWFGGQAEGWERAPYWLDGVIPLAWILDDQAAEEPHHPLRRLHRLAPAPGRLVRPVPRRRRRPAATTCGPSCSSTRRSCSTTRRPATRACSRRCKKSLRAMLDGLDRTPLYDWGRFRWFEGLVSVFYVYERTRDGWLLDLARKLRAQGVDFPALYKTEDITVPTPRRGLWKWTKHVVNTAMAAKASALGWRIDQRPSDRTFAAKMIDLLDRHHGQVNGVFGGDECLAGRNPLQGTELCAVVEFMYSLEHLFSVFGDPAFGDRLERVAFNALPATFAPDMWAHQYDQQVNQVQCTINPDHMWTTNGPESNLYGLEPNYGCCTSNMHQGWPKFAAHLWMMTPDEGLVAAAYAPSRATFRSHGVPVDGRRWTRTTRSARRWRSR